MALVETNETNFYTYESFAAYSFYTDVNRALVRQALAHFKTRPDSKSLTIVDMACGTGAVTRLIAEEIAQQGQFAHTRIIGVDPSAEALRRAEKGMDEIDLGVHAGTIHGDAADLSRLWQDVHAAFF